MCFPYMYKYEAHIWNLYGIYMYYIINTWNMYTWHDATLECLMDTASQRRMKSCSSWTHSSVQLPGHWDWSSYITAPYLTAHLSAFGEAVQSLTAVGPISLSSGHLKNPIPPATPALLSLWPASSFLCSILQWALVKHHSLNPLIMISSLTVT